MAEAVQVLSGRGETWEGCDRKKCRTQGQVNIYRPVEGGREIQENERSGM
jgi:hypothetical protein